MPHLLPIPWHYTSIYAPLAKNATQSDFLEAFRKHYGKEPFIRFSDTVIPEIKNVNYTNFVHIGFRVYTDNNQLIIFSAYPQSCERGSGASCAEYEHHVRLHRNGGTSLVTIPTLNDCPGGITAPLGFCVAGMYCGIRKIKKDIAMIVSDAPATVAGVFTLNKTQAAPVLVDKIQLKRSSVCSAIVVNSGNATPARASEG